jgi:hypothetical protein
MKPRLFGLAAILGAVGVGFCCLAPAIFSVLSISTIVSLTMLQYWWTLYLRKEPRGTSAREASRRSSRSVEIRRSGGRYRLTFEYGAFSAERL